MAAENPAGSGRREALAPPVSRGDQTWLLNEEDKMIRVAWIPSSWVSATHPHPAYAGTAGGEKVE